MDVTCTRGQVRTRRYRDRRCVVLVDHRRVELEAAILENVTHPREVTARLAQADDLGMCR